MKRGITPWSGELAQSLSGFRREFDTLFDHFFRDADWSGGFAPNTNVAETDTGFEVTFELPGVKPEDFEIELQNGQLIVRGEKKQEEEEQSKTFHRVERYYGKFHRSIPLATTVDEENVEAEYTDGVLRITIPKSAEAKPRRIKVK